MVEIFRLLDRITAADLPVVITGESGTGKELVAKAIHHNGPRATMPFVAENCAAVPPTLIESILFGHVKGAFTGAARDNRGLFAAAHKGTLFLDEIGELPIEMQAKLLRVLQEGEVRPVGSHKAVAVDVRVLAATNRDLEELVARGEFREDLFYRLNVIPVKIPPLRERREDIPLLLDHMVAKHGGDRAVKISREFMGAVQAAPWPGNVRQLENAVMRALVLGGDELSVEHLPATMDGGRVSGPVATTLEMEPRLEELKSDLIRAALRETSGNRSEAARLLGISRYGLQKMMTRMDIDPRDV